MSSKAWVYNSWSGGEATDKKVGIANSFANSQSLDFRKSPSQLSVLPGTRRSDANTVTDLIQNEVMTESGEIYAVGSSGNIYNVSSSGVWGLFGATGQAGTFGISYRKDQDAIYITGTTAVSSITTVSSAPTLNSAFYGESQSTYNNSTQAGFNVNSDQSGSVLVTALSTTFVDGDTAQERFFQTDVQPISKIGVNIIAKGTGNWTLTVHDGLNNSLGAVTVASANLNSGSVNYFTFATPIQVNVGPNAAQTYHFHLTSTVADGTVSSSATNDLSSCDMELWANRLVSTVNGIHPQVTFQQFECIGNGRYLSVWENLGEATPSNSAWQRQKLSFPPGYEVCGLTVFNEYLAIATQKVTTGDNTPQEGIIFYWDGLSPTYNYFTRIPEGSPQAIHEYENALYYVAAGIWYIITSVAATPQKIRRMPGSENIYTGATTQTQVYPYVGTVRHGIHLLGWPSITGNTTIPYGVYSWGRADYSQANSFGYSYILSTGTQFKTGSNNLTIGMVKNFGNILHISWRDDSSGATTYGVDVVDPASTPAAFSKWEALIEDAKIVTKQKLVSYMEGKWLDIDDGVSIVLKYNINRNDWVYSSGATSNAAGGYSNSNLWSVDDVVNYAKFDMGNSTEEERFHEVQFGLDIYCDSSVTNAPIIVGASGIFDDLSAEQLI